MTSSNTAQVVTPETVLDQAMQLVEDLMFEAVNSDVATLGDASRHILQAGGKRIRPRLLIAAFLACGGNNIERTLPVAAAVELVHTASVVHDDINDHGVVRRGRPSVNAIWGRTFALLTGDFLFTKVYELMAPHKDLNIFMAEAAVALVEGETLQASAVKENNLTRAVYYDIIGRKTAALFKAAAGMGAALAGATKETVQLMEQFGYSVGLAFQIVDDILDLTADETTLGKTAGIDLAQGKGFAAAYAGNGAASNGVALAESDPLDSFKKKLMEGNTLNEAREKAHQLVTLANNSLASLPDSALKQELINLARLVVDREF